MKHILTAALSTMIITSSAHAGNLVTTTKEVFNFVFSGTLIKRNSIELTQLKPNAQIENRLLYMFAEKGKKVTVVTVSRTQSKTMTQMNIEILQPLEGRAADALRQVPDAQLINGELSPQALAELNKSDLADVGERVWKNLGYVDGLRVTSVNMAQEKAYLEEAHARLASMTVSKPAPIGVVLDLAQNGPAAVYRLEFGLTSQTTTEEIHAILRAVTDALK